MAERERSQTGTSTATEVGTLIESLRNEIRVVAEGVADLRVKVDRIPAVEAGLEEVRGKLDLVLTELKRVRADLASFDTRLKVVEEKVSLS